VIVRNNGIAISFIAVIFGALQSTAVSQTAASPEKLKAEVMHLEEMRNKAMLEHDTQVLDRLYADDLAWTNPRGEVLTKAQVLADLVSGKQKFFTIAHDLIKLHVYGNTVVADGRSTSTLRYDNKEARGVQRRFVNVYIKEGGVWHMVAHEQTVMADQSGATN
jgi:ketosteroid isomerase-like protein